MRKKLALYACLILGPLMVFAGIAGMLKEHQYSSEGTLVKSEVIDSEIVKASMGPNQVRFRLKLLFDDDRNPLESYLTVYEGQANSVTNTNPLEVLYLEASPGSVQLPNAQSDAWMPIIVGLLMSVVAIRHIVKIRRLNRELTELQDSLSRFQEAEQDAT